MIEVADQTFHLTPSQYTDTGPTSFSTDSISPGARQGGHWSVNFLSHWYDWTPKKSQRKRVSNPGSSTLEADVLATRPTRRSSLNKQAYTVSSVVSVSIEFVHVRWIAIQITVLKEGTDVVVKRDPALGVRGGGGRGRRGGGGEQNLVCD